MLQDTKDYVINSKIFNTSSWADEKTFLLCVSPDNKWLARYQQSTPVVVFYDLNTGKIGRELRSGKFSDLTIMSFSEHSELFAAVVGANIVWYDMNKTSIDSHFNTKNITGSLITAISFSCPKTFLGVCSDNGEIVVVCLKSQTKLCVYNVGYSSILIFSPYQQLFAVKNHDSQLLIIDYDSSATKENRSVRATIDEPGQVMDIQFSPKELAIAYCTENEILIIDDLNLINVKKRVISGTHARDVEFVRYLNSKILVSVKREESNPQLVFWNTLNCSPLFFVSCERAGKGLTRLKTVNFVVSQNRNILAIANFDGRIDVWHNDFFLDIQIINKSKSVNIIKHSPAENIVFCHEQTLYTCCYGNNPYKIAKLSKKVMDIKFSSAVGQCYYMAVLTAPSNKVMVWNGNGNRYNKACYKFIAPCHEYSCITAISLSASYGILVCATANLRDKNSKILFVDMNKNSIINTVDSGVYKRDAVTVIDFCNGYLLSVCDMSNIKMWYFSSGVPESYRCVLEKELAFMCISMSISVEQRLLAINEANTVRLWSIENNDLQDKGALSAHQAPVSVVKFSPTAAILASKDQHGTIVIWDTNESKKLATIRDPINAEQNIFRKDLCFSPTGKKLLSTCHGKGIEILDLTAINSIANADSNTSPPLPMLRPTF